MNAYSLTLPLRRGCPTEEGPYLVWGKEGIYPAYGFVFEQDGKLRFRISVALLVDEINASLPVLLEDAKDDELPWFPEWHWVKVPEQLDLY